VSPDDNYGSPLMVTRRIADGLRRKAAEYRKGDKPQRAEGCDEDADALEALLLDYQERGRALEEANARIGVMTGRGERCPQCADTKRDCANAIAAMAVDFNRARDTLKGKSHD
jgi:hypothetical protein